MSRICQLTGKRATLGHQVSHSQVKTNRRFNPNLQTKRIFVPELGKWIVVKLTTQALRTIDKKGAYTFIKEQLAKNADLKDERIWVQDPAQLKEMGKEQRGYRRVEHVDANGKKSHSVTYAPNIPAKTKTKIGKLFA